MFSLEVKKEYQRKGVNFEIKMRKHYFILLELKAFWPSPLVRIHLDVDLGAF